MRYEWKRTATDLDVQPVNVPAASWPHPHRHTVDAPFREKHSSGSWRTLAIRKLAMVGGALTASLMVFGAMAQASDGPGNRRFSYQFHASRDEVVITRDGDGDGVEFARARQDQGRERVGHPQLPIAVRWFVLPPRTAIRNLHYQVLNELHLGDGYHVRSILPEENGGDGGERSPFDPNRPYPEAVAFQVKDVHVRGYHLAQVALYPVQYVAAPGSLFLTTAATLDLDVGPMTPEESASVIVTKRVESIAFHYPDDAAWIRALVVNPDDFARFYPYPRPDPNERRNGGQQLVSSPFGGAPTERPSIEGPPAVSVIITNNSDTGGGSVGDMVAALAPYATYKTDRFGQCVVKTVDWIVANYPAYDAAASIKAFVHDAYVQWGTRYFLLAGDTDLVPTRRIAAALWRKDSAVDAYFGVFTGLWNLDRDAYEWESPSDVNFSMSQGDFPQVSVARWPCHNATEAGLLRTKAMAYQDQLNPPPSSFFTSALLATGPTNAWYQDKPFSGYYAAEQVATPLTSAGWSITRLYADPGAHMLDCSGTQVACLGYLKAWLNTVPHTAWTGTGLRDGIQAGAHFVFHAEHSDRAKLGNPTYDDNDLFEHECFTTPFRDACIAALETDWGSVQDLTREQAYALTNGATTPKFSIVFSGGSYTNAYDMWAVSEALMLSPTGGAIAYLGKDASSGGIPYEMYKPIVDRLVGSTHAIGDAYVQGIVDEPASGYDQMENGFARVQLLGDPQVDIWSSSPTPLSVQTTPSSVTALGAQVITVTVTNANTNAAVSGAVVCVAQGQWSYATGRTDATGKLTLAGYPVRDTTPISVGVSAHNYKPYTGSVSVSAPSGFLAYESHTFSDAAPRGDGDGVLESGEAAWCRVTLRNTGTTAATSPTLSLRATPSVLLRLQVNGVSRPTRVYIGQNAAHPPATADTFRLPLSWNGVKTEGVPNYTSVKETFGVYRDNADGRYVVVSRSPSASPDSTHAGYVKAAGTITSVSMTGESGVDTYGVVGDSVWFNFKGDATDDKLYFRAEAASWCTITNGVAPVRPSVAAGDTVGRSFEVSSNGLVPDGQDLAFTVSAAHSMTKYSHSDVALRFGAPRLTVPNINETITTNTGGCNARLVLRPLLYNLGSAEAESVSVSLTNVTGQVTVVDGTAHAPACLPEEAVQCSDSIVVCAATTQALQQMTYHLSLKGHLNRPLHYVAQEVEGPGGGCNTPGQATGLSGVSYGGNVLLSWAPYSLGCYYNVYLHPSTGTDTFVGQALTESRYLVSRVNGAPLTPVDGTGKLIPYEFRVEACECGRCGPKSTPSSDVTTRLPESAGWPRRIPNGLSTAPKVFLLGTRYAVFVANRDIYAWWLDDGTPVAANAPDGKFFVVSPALPNDPDIVFTGALAYLASCPVGSPPYPTAVVGSVRRVGLFVVKIEPDAGGGGTYHGTLAWSKPVAADHSAPVVAQLDPFFGSAYEQVIVPGADDKVYVWDADGTPWITNPPPGTPNGAYALATDNAGRVSSNHGLSLAILSGSGVPPDPARIVQALRHGHVVCWNTVGRNNGALATPYWETDVEPFAGHRANGPALSTPAIGEVTGDGDEDIIVTNQTAGSGVAERVYVLSRSGGIEYSYTDPTQTVQFLSDEDFKPAPRPVVACLDAGTSGAYFIVGADRDAAGATEHSAWVFGVQNQAPYNLVRQQCVESPPLPFRGLGHARLWQESVVANIDGVAGGEIIGPSEQGGLYGWKYDTGNDGDPSVGDTWTQAAGWPTLLTDKSLPANATNSGLVVASYDGVVHVLKTPGSAGGGRYWREFGANTGNTGEVLYGSCDSGLRGDVPSTAELSVSPPLSQVGQRVRFAVPTEGWVKLGVYDVSGRMVRSFERKRVPPGRYEEVWDLNRDDGRRVPSGVYYYRLSVPRKVLTASTVIVR